MSYAEEDCTRVITENTEALTVSFDNITTVSKISGYSINGGTLTYKWNKVNSENVEIKEYFNEKIGENISIPIDKAYKIVIYCDEKSVIEATPSANDSIWEDDKYYSTLMFKYNDISIGYYKRFDDNQIQFIENQILFTKEQNNIPSSLTITAGTRVRVYYALVSEEVSE